MCIVPEALPTDVAKIAEKITHINQLVLHDVAAALAESSQLQVLCHGHLPQLLRTQLEVLHCRCLLAAGQFRLALRLINHAIRQLDEQTAAQPRAELLQMRGIILFQLKRYLSAAEDLAQATELAVEAMQIHIAIDCYMHIASIYRIYGLEHDLLALLRLGFYLAGSINDPKSIGKSAIHLAGRYFNDGQYQEALDVLYQSEASILDCGDMTWVVEAGNIMANCYRRLNKAHEAELYFDSMLALALHHQLSWARSLIAIHYATFLAERGDRVAAMSLLDSAQEGAWQFNDMDLQQRYLSCRIEIFKQQGLHAQALQALRELEQIRIAQVEGEQNPRSRRKLARLGRLQRVMATVNRTRRDFESLLGLVVSRSNISRGRLFRDKCATLPAEHAIVVVSIEAPLATRRVVEDKVTAILREFCVSGDVWVRHGLGQYLIYFHDGLQRNNVLQQQLVQHVQHFPWDWHEIPAPLVASRQVSPLEVAQLLNMRGNTWKA